MAAALAAYFAAGSKQGHRRRPGCPTNSMARSTHLNGVSEPNASMDVQVNRGSAFDVDGGPKCFRPKYKIPARATPTRSRPPGNSASSNQFDQYKARSTHSAGCLRRTPARTCRCTWAVHPTTRRRQAMAQARRRAKAQWREQRRVRDQGQLQRRASEPESHRRGRSRLLACSLARLLACSHEGKGECEPEGSNGDARVSQRATDAAGGECMPKGSGRGARVSR